MKTNKTKINYADNLLSSQLARGLQLVFEGKYDHLDSGRAKHEFYKYCLRGLRWLENKEDEEKASH